MSRPEHILGSILLLILLSALAGSAFGQDRDRWLRVMTDEDSITEVDRLSLTLNRDHVMSALFRTTLTLPEKIPGKKVTYLTRQDLIQFRPGQYRVSESTYLDASGNVVEKEAGDSSAKWKHTGRSGTRFYNAASQLRPLGEWTVISVRYTSGESISKNDSEELTSLLAASVGFGVSRVVVGGKEVCNTPSYERRSITEDEIAKRLGVPLSALSLKGDHVDGLLVGCDSPGKTTLTIAFLLPDDKALMLWNGIFLELKREKNVFLP